MQNWKNLAAVVIFCSAVSSSAQNEHRPETVEEVVEETVVEETLEALSEPLPSESTEKHAEKPQEETPAPVPVETPPQMSAPAPAVAPDKAASKQLSVGMEGFFRPGILLQGWFLARRAEETATLFRLRRVELHARGEIVPGWVAYAVMVDPTRSTDILQDFFISLKTSYMDVSLGQFKTPISWEGYNSSSRLLFPERALSSREFGDRRDMGIRLAKNFKYFGYSAGVFSGSGANVLDVDNAKDIALRLEAYPIEGLVIAGLAYATLGSRKENARDRYEIDVRFERGPFLFQSEYIRARDVKSAAPSVKGQGFYGAIAWTFLDVLQPSFRVGYMDPNIGVDMASGGKDRAWQIDAGLNYYIQKHEMKLQLAYSRLQYKTSKPSNEFILAGQVAF
ncbi:MAG: porin [Cystobacterineae bacterium]|nr:porin [Cystobacterineae bacterium]